MLERNLEHYSLQARPAVPEVSHSPALAFLAILLKRWRLIMSIELVCSILALVYILITPAQFTSSVLMLVDLKAFNSMRDIGPSVDDGLVAANIESQVEMLKSDRILRRVVEKEDLVNNPAALGPQGSLLTKRFFGTPAAEPQGDTKVIGTISKFKGMSSVRRVGRTFLIEVAVSLPNPQDAARIANDYAHIYVEDQESVRREFNARTADLLKSQTAQLRTLAENAQLRLEQFRFSGPSGIESTVAEKVKQKSLESEAQSFRAVHDRTLERYADAMLNEGATLQAQIVSPALPALSKSWPRGSIVLGAALLVGGSLAAAFALLAEWWPSLRRMMQGGSRF